MKKRLEHSHLTALLWCLLIATFLYTTRDSVYCQNVIPFSVCYAIQAVLAGIGSLGVLYRYRREPAALLQDRRVWILGVCLVLIALPMAVKRDWQLMYGTVAFAVFAAFLASFWTDTRSASRYYIAVICFFGVCSLVISCLLRPLAEAGVFTPRTISEECGYYNFCFGIFSMDPSIHNRNFGIFREPGVYQFFLILALYLNNDRAQWNSSRITWGCNGILAVTIFTTLALGGLVEMALLAVILFFDKGWYRNRKARILAFTGIGVLVAAYNIIHWIDGPLWGEIWMLKHKLFSGEDSVVERTGSLQLNLRLFLSSPVFGVKLKEILKNPALANNTSSSTILFAMLGVLGGLMHVASWIVLVWKKHRNLFFSLAYAVVLAMSFNTENLITDVFLWLFPILAVCELPVFREKP